MAPAWADNGTAGKQNGMMRKDETNMKKMMTLLLTVCLVLSLAACGGEKKQADGGEEETKTISGVVNQLDEYLVLLDSDGEYHIFDFGKDVDQSKLEEGENVTVTYTGTLDNSDPSPVAVSVVASDG